MARPPRRKSTDKDARRSAASSASRGSPDEGMFFGASPTERADLRETKDAKKLKLSDLDMNAALGRGDAPEKVGKTMSLMDMAMGNDEFAPGAKKGPAGKKRPAPRGRLLRVRTSSMVSAARGMSRSEPAR